MTLLKNAGISWRTYQENITGTDLPHELIAILTRRSTIRLCSSTTSSTATAAQAYRPFSELAGDLANNTTAHYNFITPNLINDMHDSAPPLNNPVKQGDTWLSQNLPMILQSAAYQNNGAIIITWDEGEGGRRANRDDRPLAPSQRRRLSQRHPYTHSSTLRTFQKIFGVRPLLGGAATALDLSDLFVFDAIPNADTPIAHSTGHSHRREMRDLPGRASPAWSTACNGRTA